MKQEKEHSSSFSRAAQNTNCVLLFFIRAAFEIAGEFPQHPSVYARTMHSGCIQIKRPEIRAQCFFRTPTAWRLYTKAYLQGKKKTTCG